MQSVVDTYFIRFSTFAAGIFAIVTVGIFILAQLSIYPFLCAYLLSYIFVGSNFLVMRKIKLDDNKRFVRIFGISLAVRFLLVLAALVIGLKTINNHQIFFTVSFIISYICHSVIEIIFLNKILQTDTEK